MALGDGDAWDETNPANATNLSDGDDHIRDVRKGVRIRLEYEHSTLAGSSAGGKHKFITLQTQGSKPTVDATQVAALYTKLVTGVNELFFEDEAGNEIQITSGAGLTSSGGGVQGTVKNLVVAYASASSVTVTADELVLSDTSNQKANIYSVSETIEITTSGASGLDTGAEAANTIYYLWIIRKSSDGTVNGLMSLSSTAPTMPAGYDQKALVSAVGNNNSSNFISFTQTGRRYCFTAWATIASGTVAAWTAVDLTPANLTTNAGFVPSGLSNFCFGTIASTAADVILSNNNTVATSTTLAPNKYILDFATGQVGTTQPWQFDVITADTLYWGGSSADAIVYLHGFECNKLGL